MTREEAIRWLKEDIDENGDEYVCEYIEAVEMAIKALEQEPCEDCVSREQLKRELHAQMAVDAITKETAEDMLNHLPSVTPQPRAGHWIRHDNGKYHWYLCSCCDAMADSDAKMMAYKYCPNCGAKMESEVKE